MSDRSLIKQHKTSVDDNNEYREYRVYEKEGKFVAECIGWKIKDMTRAGGSRDFYQEFDTEEEAIGKYDELVETWEA